MLRAGPDADPGADTGSVCSEETTVSDVSLRECVAGSDAEDGEAVGPAAAVAGLCVAADLTLPQEPAAAPAGAPSQQAASTPRQTARQRAAAPRGTPGSRRRPSALDGLPDNPTLLPTLRAKRAQLALQPAATPQGVYDKAAGMLEGQLPVAGTRAGPGAVLTQRMLRSLGAWWGSWPSGGRGRAC